MWILTIVFALIAGLLYRLGGIGKPFDTKYRDLGVPIIVTIWMITFGYFHWSLLFCFGALFGAMTTYNKWVGYFFNRPDKSTVYWESWLVTGLFYGLAILPYCIFQGHWVGFGIRAVICAVFCCLWSQFIGKDWLEEGGRGAIVVLTLPFVFLV